MNNLYAFIDGKACEFPVVDPVLELDQIADEPIVTCLTTTGIAHVNVKLNNVSGFINNFQVYEDFLSKLVSNKIKELTSMTNTYKVFVDTVIYDNKRKVIDEGIKIHSVMANDGIRLMPVDATNHQDYILTKIFDLHIPYQFAATRSGIVMEAKVPRYFQIRSITVYAEMNTANDSSAGYQLSQTILDRTISPVSQSLETAKSNLVEVLTATCGHPVIDLGTMNSAKSIDLNLHISTDGFLQAYDTTEIDKILAENAKTPDPSDPSDPGSGGGSGTDDDNNDDHGSTDTNGDGEDDFFSQYERCSSDDADARIVVADVNYQAGKNYKYTEVKEDIPNIAIGDYVKYVRSLIVSI